MASIFGVETGLEIPSLNPFGSGSSVLIMGSIFLIILSFAVIIYFVYMRRLYNKTVIIFENLAGIGFQKTGQDKARLLKIGDGGEELLLLRKRKIYMTAYGRKMGVNTYWFAKTSDGYYHNFILGDLDAKKGMLDIFFTESDMRYMNTAIRKNIAERFKKTNFMEKYGALVFNGFIMLIFLIGAWFLLEKMGDVSATINYGIEASMRVVDSTANILDGLQNVCSGGSGLTPA